MNAKLKQRLVGALVLLALAVLAWPLLMGPAKDRNVVIESKIPPRADFQPFEVPVAEKPTGLAEPGDWQEQVIASQEEVEPAQPVAVDAEDSSLQARAPISAGLDETGLPQGWMVQVGSFGQLENAEKLAEKLRLAGYKTFVKAAELDESKLTKVYVGPLLDEAMAGQVANDIKAQFQLAPKISKFLP